MYSEGLERLTVYGSSNIERKLQTKLSEKHLYSVSFCEDGSSLFESSALGKGSVIQQVLDYLDYRFAVIDFQGSVGYCKISIVNTDFTIIVVSCS